MAELTYHLLATEGLVVEPARGWARIEFSAIEVRKAVEVGANLAIKNEKVSVGEEESEGSKCLILYVIHSFG